MNNNLRDATDLVVSAADEFWTAVAGFLPRIIGALVLIVIGALVAKLLADFTRWGLEKLGVNKLNKNRTVTQAFKKADLKVNLVDISARIVFWLVIIVFAMAAVDVLELDAMREAIREILAYVPNVIAAVVVLAVAVPGARLLKAFVAGGLRQLSADFADLLGTISQVVVLVFGIVLAAAQLGFDMTLLVANLSVIVAGAALAAALAFGLGGRSLAANLMASSYTQANFKKGQQVTVAGLKGKVKEAGRIALVLETKDGDVVVPNSQVVS